MFFFAEMHLTPQTSCRPVQAQPAPPCTACPSLYRFNTLVPPDCSCTGGQRQGSDPWADQMARLIQDLDSGRPGRGDDGQGGEGDAVSVGEIQGNDGWGAGAADSSSDGGPQATKEMSLSKVGGTGRRGILSNGGLFSPWYFWILYLTHILSCCPLWMYL